MASGKLFQMTSLGNSFTGSWKASAFVLRAVVTMIKNGEKKIKLSTITRIYFGIGFKRFL